MPSCRRISVSGAPQWPSACPTTRPHLRELTEHWRPWRSYAMAHLWSLPAAASTAAPHPTNERTCRMTTTTTTTTMPLDTPIGQIVLEGDGDVLIGLWLPNDAVAIGRRDRGVAHSEGGRDAARGVLRRRAHRVRPAHGARRHRVPARGVGRAGAHPLRRDHQLRRAGPPGRAAQGAAGSGPGQRPEPDCHHRALPPRAGEQRHRRLRRRAEGQARAASRWRVSRPRVRRWKRPGVCTTRST